MTLVGGRGGTFRGSPNNYLLDKFILMSELPLVGRHLNTHNNSTTKRINGSFITDDNFGRLKNSDHFEVQFICARILCIG